MKILQRKTFNTGRLYTAEGQTIHTWLVDVDDVGRLLFFFDESRLVHGMYRFNNDSIESLTEGTIMRIYDNSLHDSGLDKEDGSRFYEHELQDMLISAGEPSKQIRGW